MAQAAADHKAVAAAGSPLPEGFVLVAVGRFVTNVSFRLVFPFLPRIASGLGVSLTTMGTALAARDLAGVASPALGRAADRRGHVRAMSFGLGLLAVALVLQGASNGLVAFTLALVLVSMAKNLFDAGSAAWVGGAVPFAQRGRAMGIVEMSWAASFILAMPVAAALIRGTTWRTPFLVAAASCAVVALALQARVPRLASDTGSSPRMRWTPVLRSAVGTMAAIGIGHSMMLVSFAAWLEDEHGLSVSGLGLTALVIGVAELGGSGGSAALSDRLGIANVLATSLALSVPASALLWLGDTSLPAALALMAAYFVVVELAIVALLSLFTELDSRARGGAMGWAFASFTIGHAVGAVAGAQLYERAGMGVNGFGMAAAFAAALGLVHWGLRAGAATP